MTKLRVAVVGAGAWGLQHLRVFTAREDIDVVGVFARTLEKVEARAEKFGVRAYTNLQQMLDTEKPDLVSVSLPNQAHFETTLAIIRAGYPLLVEKPLVFDIAEADTLLAEAAKRKLFFAINFNHRYAKPVRLAKDAINAGRVGKIVFASWRFGGEGGADHPFGNLIETQCHGFDMLEHLCGPIASVAAQMTDMTRPGAFTTMAIALKFESGAVGTLLGSYDASYAHPGTHAVEINGTHGRILIEDTVRKYTFHEHGSELGQTWQAGYFNDRDREFLKTFDEYLEPMLQAIRNGDPPPVPATDGRRALVLAEAAIRSFQERRVVEVT